jgi:hypothetical protein
MQDWTLEGKPRSGRGDSQYANCRLPSREDRLLFILTSLNQAASQAFHGAAFAMAQPKAPQSIQALLPALRSALASLGDLPSRTLSQLRQRLSDLSEQAVASPCFTLAPNAPSAVAKTRMNRSAVLAARTSAIA